MKCLIFRFFRNFIKIDIRYSTQDDFDELYYINYLNNLRSINIMVLMNKTT